MANSNILRGSKKYSLLSSRLFLSPIFSLGKLLIWILSYIDSEQVLWCRGAVGTGHSQAPFVSPQALFKGSRSSKEVVFLQTSEMSPKYPATASVTSPACPLTALCLTPLHQPSRLLFHSCPLLRTSSGP